MPQLLVRNIDDELVNELKRRAAANHRSAEAEHRAILAAALSATQEPFVAWARRLREATAGRLANESADLLQSDREAR
jgi:plasmid stability protein